VGQALSFWRGVTGVLAKGKGPSCLNRSKQNEKKKRATSPDQKRVEPKEAAAVPNSTKRGGTRPIVEKERTRGQKKKKS